MTANAITISSRLEAAGLEKRTADAVASEIVDYSDDSVATKADIANLKAEIADLKIAIAELRTQSKIMMAMLSVLLLSVIVPLFG